MEDLTKQQIVLVTLLVSFVTSIATGIVTVSLVDQAPKAVTQTIDRVVEKTIERVVPNQTASVSDGGSSSAGTIKVQDQLADAVDKSSRGLVRIKHVYRDVAYKPEITGFGIVVSRDGVIVTDKSTVTDGDSYVAVFSDNTEVPVKMFQSQNNGDIAFLIAQPAVGTSSKPIVFKPITFSTSTPRLGQSVFAIGGGETLKLAQGFISNADTEKSIETSIPSKSVMVGGPLITSSGEFIGIKTASFDYMGANAIFYPFSLIRPAIPQEGTFSR